VKAATKTATREGLAVTPSPVRTGQAYAVTVGSKTGHHDWLHCAPLLLFAPRSTSAGFAWPLVPFVSSGELSCSSSSAGGFGYASARRAMSVGCAGNEMDRIE